MSLGLYNDGVGALDESWNDSLGWWWTNFEGWHDNEWNDWSPVSTGKRESTQEAARHEQTASVSYVIAGLATEPKTQPRLSRGEFVSWPPLQSWTVRDAASGLMTYVLVGAYMLIATLGLEGMLLRMNCRPCPTFRLSRNRISLESSACKHSAMHSSRRRMPAHSADETSLLGFDPV